MARKSIPVPASARERVGRSASSIDVARVAGVSQSAVSRAFSPNGRISEATRAKVKAAAEQLGYFPNALASSIITKRTRIVALVVGDIENPTYSKIVNTFSMLFQARGYHVLLFSLSMDAQANEAIEELLKYRVDGVLLTAAPFTLPMAQACERAGVPALLFNRYSRHPNVSSVRLDNLGAAGLMAEHLVRSGYRRIAYVIGGGPDETAADRERGFVETLKAHGVTPHARLEGDYSLASGEQAMAELWRAKSKPDAVFLSADIMAFGALSYAKLNLGLRVPQDVAIAGFDDQAQASWPFFDLTTVRQPLPELARVAADLLLEKMSENAGRARTVLIPADLVVRGSAPAR